MHGRRVGVYSPIVFITVHYQGSGHWLYWLQNFHGCDGMMPYFSWHQYCICDGVPELKCPEVPYTLSNIIKIDRSHSV